MATQMIFSHEHRQTNTTHNDDDDDDKSIIPPALILTSDSFLKAAVSLKDQVVEATWRKKGVAESGGGRCVDPTVFTGLMGTAFVCLRSYLATGSQRDLVTAGEVADTCAAVATTFQRGVTFLCGTAGVYALGAVAANYRSDHQSRDLFLDRFLEVGHERALAVGREEGGLGMSYDLLHGRAGFLWCALFVNEHIGSNTVPADLVAPIAEAILSGGRAGASDNTECPLMYRWHGTRYWGAAHGLAGIIQVLLHLPLSGKDLQDVKDTLGYMVRNRFTSTGNYPSSDGNHRENHVRWAHGAGGVCITLCKASQLFANENGFYDASVEAGEVVWKKGLVRKVGLFDGITGNAYTFLSLYRLTGKKVYLDRAKSFGSYLYHNAGKLLSGGLPGEHDHVYSLYDGLAGTSCLWFDTVNPDNSRFPGFEI